MSLKTYTIDNKEFKVYIDEKSIIIKHIELELSKKYIVKIVDKTSHFKMLENNNETIYKYVIDCFEGNKFSLTRNKNNEYILSNTIFSEYKKEITNFILIQLSLNKNDILEIEYEKL